MLLMFLPIFGCSQMKSLQRRKRLNTLEVLYTQSFPLNDLKHDLYTLKSGLLTEGCLGSMCVCVKVENSNQKPWKL